MLYLKKRRVKKQVSVSEAGRDVSMICVVTFYQGSWVKKLKRKQCPLVVPADAYTEDTVPSLGIMLQAKDREIADH